MENRRLLIATFLSALVLILWTQVMKRVAPPEEVGPSMAAEQPASSEGVPAPVAEPGAEAEPPAPEPPASGEPLPAPAAEEAPATQIDFFAEEVVAAGEERVVIETDEVRAELLNRGAQLVSYQLKKHRTAAGGLVELVRSRGTDLYPFALVRAGGEPHPLDEALFVGRQETGEEGLPVLRFQYKGPLGAAEKVFRWTPESMLEVEITVQGRDRWGVLFGPGVRDLETGEKGNRFLQQQASYHQGGESSTISAAKEKEDLRLPATDLRWIGLEDNFFLTAVIPRRGLLNAVIRPVFQRATVEAGQPRFLPGGVEHDEKDIGHELEVVLEASGDHLDLLTFFGAKRYRRLAALPYGLEETVRWGTYLGVLARPLYFSLEWIHDRIVANYGWAIVLVTCLIKLLFFPLTFKSQESMSRMQELNPKVQAIRTKYRSKLKDRQGRPNAEAQRALNEEIMAVYKQAGVNPVSGCFPILLQMPVFFAFYRLLATAVELRGAPWLGWIRDLSVSDPYYVLPIVMGASSIAMQKMMPQSPDPTQRRMMQVMPLMFMFFAFAFPSGLVLYWVTNNVLTMIQQAVTVRLRRTGAAPQEAGGKA